MNTIHEMSSVDLKQLGNQGYALAMQILRHREDAADAVQDALHQLFKHRSSFDSARGTLQAWFLKIVRNRCIDIKRKTKPVSTTNPGEIVDSLHSNPQDAAQQNELVQTALAALDKMPGDAREIILLRDYHDLSYAQIADVLGVPAGTVMSRLHRAREKLRNMVLGK